MMRIGLRPALATLSLCFVVAIPASKMGRRVFGESSRTALTASAGGVYPDSPQHLAAMRDQQNQPAMRAHAWAILLELTKGVAGSPADGSSPLWEDGTWKDKCGVGLAPGLVKQCGPSTHPAAVTRAACPPPDSTGPTSLSIPVQDNAGHDPAFTLSSVRYNPTAASFIRSHCLNTPDGLAKLAKQEEGAGASDPKNQFPTSAEVVKLIWAMPDSDEALPDGSDLPEGYGRIGAWDPSLVSRNDVDQDVINPGPGKAGSRWRFVVVNLDETARCNSRNYKYQQDAGYDFKKDAVPIKCFYHKTIDCKNIMAGTGEFLGPRQFCPPGSTTQPVVILVGVHVITAELPDWVWSTFWWTNHPDSDPIQHDRPAGLTQRGAWSFYSMDTTMSPTKPADPVDHGPKIAFNPYLEGANRNGPVSNCMFCHHMAVYRPDGKYAVLAETVAGSPTRCAYLTPDDPACLKTLQSDSSPLPVLLPTKAYFQNAIPTHFLWSLAVAQDDEALRDIPTVELNQARRPR